LSNFEKEIPLMEVSDQNIVLFHQHVPESAASAVEEVLKTRWIGQGPKVELFEKLFSDKFCDNNTALAVGSGTDALHLAYLLAGIERGDEVIVPVFTCTATNIPLLYIGAVPIFADIDPNTMNISVDHVRELINEKTKAIVCVHYAGLPCDMDELKALAHEYGIPIIEDAAHAVGASYKGVPVGAISEFTMFSFQAIKHITTGDGGLVTFKNGNLEEIGKRLRWFGIDRNKKQLGIWENDIKEIGYKYQMTDISAAIGIAGLEEFNETLDLRKKLLARYEENFKNIKNVKFLGETKGDRVHAAWLCTIAIDDRKSLQKKLYSRGIESNQVHYRNDRYSIFGERRLNLPNMDKMEDRYLVLPLHTKMNTDDVDRVTSTISSGW